METEIRSHKTRKFAKNWVIVFLILIGGLIMLFLLLLGFDYLYYSKRIYPGVQVNDIPLGGLTIDAALAELEARLWSADKVELILADDQTMVFPLSELGLAWNKVKTKREIIEAWRGWSGYRARLDYLIHKKPLIIKPVLAVNEAKLAEAAAHLAGIIYRPSRDAYCTVEGETVTIHSEQNGCFLKVKGLRNSLWEALCRAETAITVPIGEWPAPLTASELKGYGFDTVMASYTTTVAAGNPDRTENVRISAAAINGYLMAPGDLFSFWTVVGEATLEKGYRYAPVIRAGEIVPGIGGGMCQVSSTLYNAALLANLTIVERYNHSLAQGYIPLGRDATVAYPGADIKFINSRDHHVLIGSELTNNKLTFRIFGPPMEERVEIISGKAEQIAPPVRYEKTDALPEGVTELVRAGVPGYRISTWRVVYRGDTEIKRELLSHDYYKPRETVYRIGTGDD